ncbi:hypothetical protein C8J55DRAFT_557161 [Lentinula edodes]|uniref:Uncharacterized protein n=1 Tax=Lentinula lateritia TaxID=40482 RepID=A0A9W9AVR5_9AGAR|nr:hypothetical protein C8J55DRAFT_557161 [Lentinula edodes]
MRLNVAPLVLALAAAVYAVPITNENPVVAPPEATVVPRGASLSQMSPVHMAVGAMIGNLFYLSLKTIADSRRNPDLVSFIREVRAIHRVPTESQAPANPDGPIHYQFFVHPPSAETHDHSVKLKAQNAVHSILRPFGGTREIVEEEGHLMSSLEMFGFQVNSPVVIGDPAERVICPCDVWVRVKEVEGQRPITALLTSHATKKEAVYLTVFERQ